MKRIINRPKMTLVVAFLAALLLDFVLGVLFGIQWNILVAITFGWMCFVSLAILVLKLVTKIKEKHINWKKYELVRPIKKVSAVVPNYNYADYLRERIDSIMSQTYPIYELVILD